MLHVLTMSELVQDMWSQRSQYRVKPMFSMFVFLSIINNSIPETVNLAKKSLSSPTFNYSKYHQ